MNTELFRKQYNEEHKCCPKCGNEDHYSTMAGYILDVSKPEEYKNLNRCECVNCGDKHLAHDRVPKNNKI